MTAATKTEFLQTLDSELRRIGIDDTEDILSDFEEHFKSGAQIGISEEETCKRLGDVKEIARNYLNLESSRLNSIIAAANEVSKPKVSLTKAGMDVPADLSLVKEKSEPVREYTPEHYSEEIYPDIASERESAAAENADKAENAEKASVGGEGSSSGAGSASQTTQTEQNEQSQQNTQSVADAFGAVGKAAAEAAKAVGHAAAEAFSTDEVKSAGKSAADAVKNAGQAVAEAVKSSAENAKSAHEQRRAAHGDIPKSSDEHRRHNSSDRKGTIPKQKYENVGSGKSFRFDDIKGKSPNPDWGRLIGCICMDVFLWSWILCALVSVAVALVTAAFPSLLGSGFGFIFGASSFYFISRLFFGIGMISLGIILLLLGIMLIKAIVKIVKSIVIQHIKAIYGV